MKKNSIQYELDNPQEFEKVCHIPSSYGIHLETDLFGKVYIILDRYLLGKIKEKENS